MVRECIAKTDNCVFNLSSKTQSTVNDTNESFEKLIETIAKDVNSFGNELSETVIVEDGELVGNRQGINQALSYILNNKTELSGEDTKKSDIDYTEILNYVNQIIELIQEKFSLTEEQFNQLLEENEINKADLLTNSGVTEILTKLSPQENIFNLLTNSNFTETVKGIFKVVNDAKEMLSTKYNMNSETFDEFIKKVDYLLNQTKVESVTQSVYLSETVNSIEPDSSNEADKSSETVPIDNLKVNEESNQPFKTAFYPSDENINSTEKNLTDKANNLKISLENQNETVIKAMSNESGLQQSLSKEETANNNLAQLFTDKISQVIQESSEDVDVSRIIKQIVDEVKITIKQDISKMEMQLYPEHLGKISLEIVAKEGTVTAQIVASSLAVKEAIESNIPLLRTNMENQGLKVEAIEVTIASHEFEQNSNGKSDRDEQQTSKRRNLNNLNGFETDLDIKSIDELQEEQRMKIDGHSVSFKA